MDDSGRPSCEKREPNTKGDADQKPRRNHVRVQRHMQDDAKLTRALTVAEVVYRVGRFSKYTCKYGITNRYIDRRQGQRSRGKLIYGEERDIPGHLASSRLPVANESSHFVSNFASSIFLFINKQLCLQDLFLLPFVSAQTSSAKAGSAM